MRSSLVSASAVIFFSLSGLLAACGDDGPSEGSDAQGGGGSDAAGSPGVGAEAGAGGRGEATGGAAGADSESSLGGAGGEGGEQLPTFERYSFDVLIADYYGYDGLYRLTLSDQGASEPIALFEVAPGQRTLWQSPHGDAIIFTLKDDTFGHLYRQPLAGGDAVRITHDLAEHEVVDKWATLGDTIYYAVGTFSGNSQTHPSALWKAEPKAGGYERTQIKLPEPSDAHALYHLRAVGDSIYVPGSVVSLGGGYVLDRLVPPSVELKPVGLLDYEFDWHYANGILTYRGKSEQGSYGIYAADLDQAKPTGRRLSPDNVILGNNPQLHGPSKHFFFSTKPEGEGEQGYYVDLSSEQSEVIPLHQSEDTKAILTAAWSSQGRYLYLHDGQLGVDVTTYVVDTNQEKPVPRLTRRPNGTGWLSVSSDERFYSIVQPELWVMKPDDADFALHIDEAIELDGATVESAAFSDDGYHVWLSLSDGRNFVEDTLASTPPNPIEVTPPDLPEGWSAKYATPTAHGGFLLAASTADAAAKEAHADQALYYLPRHENGSYGPAERVAISGSRYVLTIE